MEIKQFFRYEVGVVEHDGEKRMQVTLQFPHSRTKAAHTLTGDLAHQLTDSLRSLLNEFESVALQLDLEEGNHV